MQNKITSKCYKNVLLYIIYFLHISVWSHFPRDLCAANSTVNSPHKGQGREAFLFSLISDWINGWVNNREAGYLIRHPAHYDVTVMQNPAIVQLIHHRNKGIYEQLHSENNVGITLAMC